MSESAPGAPTPGQAAIPLMELSDQEKVTLLVRAAKTYDHDNRPRGGNWGSVPDRQVARLILGALGALDPQPAPELARQIRLVPRAELAAATVARDEYRANAILHIRERDEAREQAQGYRRHLDDFTRTVINVSHRPALTALARDVRKNNGMETL